MNEAGAILSVSVDWYGMLNTIFFRGPAMPVMVDYLNPRWPHLRRAEP